jgi:hypothetical protein
MTNEKNQPVKVYQNNSTENFDQSAPQEYNGI